MPTTIQIANRYVQWDPVSGASITFDNDPTIATTPRTGANGTARVATEALTDGMHVMHVTPSHTSTLPVGPAVAEDLAQNVKRMFRSLDVNVVLNKGQIQSLNVPAGQALNGAVGAGTNPIHIQLQPIYHRSPNQTSQTRKYEEVTLIVVHQTAGSNNIGGTLQWFEGTGSQVSSHYVISAESPAQVVKVVQDSRVAWQAGRDTWWAGKEGVNLYSIGIELSHKAGTPWPAAQMQALVDFLELLLKAYPTIRRNRIVGHMDILTDAQHVLIGRDCPGLEFDWALLEKHGLGLIPQAGNVRLGSYYEEFFRYATAPNDSLRINDSDRSRRWGGVNWPAPKPGRGPLDDEEAAPQTITGHPIEELQTDLRDIGYSVNVDGNFTSRTQKAVEMFQQHFFSGTRRGYIQDTERRRVGMTTAEFIKRVR